LSFGLTLGLSRASRRTIRSRRLGRKRFMLRKVWFDPFQMEAVAQRLSKAGIKIEPYAQTVPNLTAATSNLFDLIASRQLVTYPSPDLRLAISRAIIVESSRGWRLDKLKQAHKIDVVVALSMAALAAIRGQGESSYLSDLSWVSDRDDSDDDDAAKRFQENRYWNHIRAHSGYYSGFSRWR
jgi:phage terminase large subunit-like protein